MKRVALGRGLEALLPATKPITDKEITEVEVGRIRPNRYQPRKQFDDSKIAELAESIRQRGFIQPVVVTRLDDGFELIVGERRHRAATLLNFEKIPAIVYDEITRQDMMEMALIENLQRENLNPIEEAEAFQQLVQSCGLSQEELARKVGKDRSSVANSLRLLTLPEKVSRMVVEGKLSAGAARVILAVPGDKEKIDLAEKAVREEYSVRDLERIVYGESRKRLSRRAAMKSPHLQSIEERLKSKLQTKVSITPRKKGGRIIIEYYNNTGLTRILEELKVVED
jgi:ParB family chromosome partitioning protein